MMMSIQEWTNEVQLCVTYEALNIAKYRFMCRAPFTIGDTTYLDDGIIEEQNLAAINGESSKPSGKMEKIAVQRYRFQKCNVLIFFCEDQVGDAEINCSGHVLREIFSEEKTRSSFDLNVKPAAEVGGKDVHMNGGEAGVGNETRNEPQCDFFFLVTQTFIQTLKPSKDGVHYISFKQQSLTSCDLQTEYFTLSGSGKYYCNNLAFRLVCQFMYI